ncbi:MAG: cyclic nucleotide-binding domain-containing protein [Hyphomicrobiales bacterium]|nr:cyclic nucleotide-binding domain-containing protein [Hyphomicrobiales bacterium]
MRKEEILEASALPLFKGVSSEVTADLLGVSFLQRFPAKVELIREGDPADFLHLILEGQVEVYSSHGGRETTISILGPGQSFIVAAIVLDRVYLKSSRTLSASRILMIPAEPLRQHAVWDNELSRNISAEMALAYRSLVKELKNLKLRSAQERLANWLLVQHAINGFAREFEIPFDKKVLASQLGMAPEVLSRSFTALSSYSVRIRGTSCTIADVGSLARLANPTATYDEPETRT